MTVGDLREALEMFDPALLVIMACDEEGNAFSPLAPEFAQAMYDDEEVRFEDDYPDEPFVADAIALWPGR